VQELQFSLAKGRWSQAWGLPPMSVPSGAAVRAWQSRSLTEEQQRHHFRDMVHGLAGLTGTALAASTEDDAISWEPSKRMHLGERIFPGESDSSEADVLSAFLPWESSCTENLQVWPHHFIEPSVQRSVTASVVCATASLVCILCLTLPSSPFCVCFRVGARV
jgi:hypothetical protein